MKQVWITLGVFLILAFSSLGMTAGAGPGGPGSGGPGQVIGPGITADVKRTHII